MATVGKTLRAAAIALFTFSSGMQIWARDVIDHVRGTLSAGPSKPDGSSTAAAAAPQ